MAPASPDRPNPPPAELDRPAPLPLTPAERESIRRQGALARTLEHEQREIRERLSIAAAAARLREAEGGEQPARHH